MPTLDRILQKDKAARNKVPVVKPLQKIKSWEKQLLDAISSAMSEFFMGAKPSSVFEKLLEELLILTDSEYGFIGEVFKDEEEHRCLKTYAITNIAWNAETRKFYKENAPEGLVFKNHNTLFGYVLIHGEVLISNDPKNDARAGGRPEGHPDLNSFLGLPLFANNRMCGMVGIANRPDGYTQALIKDLEPFLSTCGNLLEGINIDRVRLASQSALMSSEQTLRATVDGAFDAIISITRFGDIGTANPAAGKLFHTKPELLIGCNIGLFLPELLKEIKNDNDKWIDMDSYLGTNRHMVGLRFDGIQIPVGVSINRIIKEGSPYYTLIVRDRTEQVKIDNLKNEFVSTVSHELRTPLTSVNGALTIIKNYKGIDKKINHSLLDVALQGTQRLMTLVDDILDISKIEQGIIKFDFANYSIKRIIETTIQSLFSLAERHNVQIKTNFHDEADHQVYVDSDRQIQVLVNILSNSIKYSNSKENISIDYHAKDGYLQVNVWDQGPGIPEEYRDKIFEKFVQIDSSDRRKVQGNGIGLHIARSLMSSMGGEIGFENQKVGCKFFVRIPLSR